MTDKKWQNTVKPERVYDPNIINLLGYLAENTDLLQKLVEVECSEYEDETMPPRAWRMRAEASAYKHIFDIAKKHIPKQARHLSSIDLDDDLRTQAEKIAAFAGQTASRQSDYDKTNKWKWREIAGKMAVDMLIEMCSPPATPTLPRRISNVLMSSMEEAIKLRDEAEKNGDKRKTELSIDINAHTEQVNLQLFTAHRILRHKKHDEQHARPSLDSTGDGLLWITFALCHENYPHSLEHLKGIVEELGVKCERKPTQMLRALHNALTGLVSDDKTHAGQIGYQKPVTDEISGLYYDELGG